MDHRLFAVLALICFALGGAGCASQSQIESREQILMPHQTGSAFQRRVMVQKEPTRKPKKKKKEKEEKPEKKEKESKRTSPTPTPAPPVTEEEPTAAPDRFR